MTAKKSKNKTIGEIIAEARKKSGLSLRAVAARIPINFSYLREIETGRRMPSERVIKELSELPELGLDFDHMMAHSGRFGEEAEKYLADHPSFGSLLRKIAVNKLNEDQLEELHKKVDEIRS